MFGWIKKIPWRKVITLGVSAYFERDKLSQVAKEINREMVEDIVFDIVMSDPQADQGQIERHVLNALRERGIMDTMTVRRAVMMFLPKAVEAARVKQQADASKVTIKDRRRRR